MHYSALSRVLREGCTGVDAARATNLTPRTVMKHVYIVRDALNLPQPRKAKQQTNHKSRENEIKGENFLEKGSFLEVQQIESLRNLFFHFFIFLFFFFIFKYNVLALLCRRVITVMRMTQI